MSQITDDPKVARSEGRHLVGVGYSTMPAYLADALRRLADAYLKADARGRAYILDSAEHTAATYPEHRAPILTLVAKFEGSGRTRGSKS